MQNTKRSKTKTKRGNADVVFRRGIHFTPMPDLVHSFSFRKAYGDVASNGSGVISSYISDDASIFTNWSSITSLYDEYRIVRMKYQWLPSTRSTSLAYSPGYVIFDGDDTTGPVSTVDGAMQYDNCGVVDLTEPWCYDVRLPQPTSQYAVTGSYTVKAGGWRDLASGFTSCCIQLFAASLTASTVYGQFVEEMVIEVRRQR